MVGQGELALKVAVPNRCGQHARVHVAVVRAAVDGEVAEARLGGQGVRGAKGGESWGAWVVSHGEHV